MTQEINYEPLTPTKGQAEYLLHFLNPEVDEIFYVGGWGAGKTQALVQGVIEVAHKIPNNRIAVCRKARVDAIGTTFVEFMNSIDRGLIVKEEKAENKYWLRSIHPSFPSCVEFRGLDEASRWGSTQYAHIFVDEASELSRTDFELIRGRLRHPFKTGRYNLLEFLASQESPFLYNFWDEEKGEEDFDVHRFIACITNPTDVFHWIHDYCVDHPEDHRRLVQVSSKDNWEHLPHSYKKILDNTPKNLRATKVDGKWGLEVSGPPCTPSFSEDKNVFTAPTPSYPVHVYRGWDFGYTYPAVSFWLLIDGIFYKFYEILGKNEILDYTIINADKISKEFHPDSTFEDHVDHHAGLQHTDKSKKTSKDILRDHGMFPRSKSSSPEDRAELFIWGFESGKFMVHSRCTNSIIGYNGGFCRDEKSLRIDKDPKNPYHNVADSDGYVLFNVLGPKRREPIGIRTNSGSSPVRLLDKLRGVFRPNKRNRPDFNAGYRTQGQD